VKLSLIVALDVSLSTPTIPDKITPPLAGVTDPGWGLADVTVVPFWSKKQADVVAGPPKA
jgi:hypothetical protein